MKHPASIYTTKHENTQDWHIVITSQNHDNDNDDDNVKGERRKQKLSTNKNLLSYNLRYRVSWILVCIERSTGYLSSSAAYCWLDITHHKISNIINSQQSFRLHLPQLSIIFLISSRGCLTQHTQKNKFESCWWFR